MKHTIITLVFGNEIKDDETRLVTESLARELRTSVEAGSAGILGPLEVRVGKAILKVEPRT